MAFKSAIIEHFINSFKCEWAYCWAFETILISGENTMENIFFSQLEDILNLVKKEGEISRNWAI